MTPTQFVEANIGYARQVQATYGLNAWAILTQWALETGWGTSALYLQGHNFAGVKITDPRTGELVFGQWGTYAEGLSAYINTLGLGYYVAVRATAGQPVTTTLAAFGNSPWDAGHYGTPPGSSLINLWTTYLLPVYNAQGGVGDPTTLFAQLWVDIIALERAAKVIYQPAPWAGAQGLQGEHLGTVPTVADGANYVAGMLQDIAIAEQPGTAWSLTGTAPAGSTDPAAVLGPVYVALVHAAESVGTDVLGLPWAAAQGLTAHHWGHPPDLDSGISYLDGQVTALTRYLGGQLSTVTPPAGGGTATGGGAVPPPPTGGTGGPLPVPPPSAGSGQAGLEAAWSALMTLLGTTLPAAANNVAAELSKATGGTYEGPH